MISKFVGLLQTSKTACELGFLSLNDGMEIVWHVESRVLSRFLSQKSGSLLSFECSARVPDKDFLPANMKQSKSVGNGLSNDRFQKCYRVLCPVRSALISMPTFNLERGRAWGTGFPKAHVLIKVGISHLRINTPLHSFFGSTRLL